MLYPYKMTPSCKDRVWGGHNLKRLGKVVPEDRIAETWELSAMLGSESRIANGVLKGRRFTEVIEKFGGVVLGKRFALKGQKRLPVMLKFIDANDRLSIQVHPDDEYAMEHENGKSGKTEMWYIVDAKPSATIIHGFCQNYSNDKIREAVLKCKYKGLYREVPVKKGDVVYVPAGTVHALNDGIVVAEIQQHSDLTYRLFDYDRKDSEGRKRPLHLKKALDVLDFRSYKPLYKGIPIYYDKIKTRILAVSKYFCVRLIEGRDVPVELVADGSFSAFMFIEGEARIVSDTETVPAGALETVFIPAYLGSYKIEGVFSALQIFVPDSVMDIYACLMEEGFSQDEIIQNVAGFEDPSMTIKIAV